MAKTKTRKKHEEVVEAFNKLQEALESINLTDEAAELKATGQLVVALTKEQRQAKIKAIEVAGKMTDKIAQFIKSNVSKYNIDVEAFMDDMREVFDKLENALSENLMDYFEEALEKEKEEQD